MAILNPRYRISILEKTDKLLSKVKISGGGRCNVTHSCFDNSELVKNYPRGQKELLQLFSRFSVKDTIDWFSQHGVALKTEEDGRIFPASDNSMSIVNCFLNLAEKLHINRITKCEVFSIHKKDDFIIKTSQGSMNADSIICASGGHHKSGAYDWIKNLGHTIDEPIPSLFTFNLPKDSIKKELQGISVKAAKVSVLHSKLNYVGPVLITHWGLSGPAVLKLSAFAAKDFYNLNYVATIIVNWVYPLKLEEVESEIKKIQKSRHKASPNSNAHFGLPKRLWDYLCSLADIDKEKPWAEIGLKQIKKLSQFLHSSTYQMEGKTTFKEEFVTCGGVNLKEVNFKTMESKIIPGLFFCGEVLNIDGITGGFNFQSAWSTAWVSAQSV